MDPVTQGALGAALSQARSTPERIRACAFLGCLAGMAPDLDIFIRSPTDPLLFLEYHRQFTHALIFIPVGAAICGAILHWFVRRRLSFKETYLACFLGYATHGVLDACTSYGTQLFWPFTDWRIAWNNVSVIDPLFSLPLLALVIAAFVRRRSAYAVAGMVWAIAYLLIGLVQHERALGAAAELIAKRGHAHVRLEAKPGFANLVLWKIIYEYDGRYYVDSVRVAATTSVCEGGSIAKLDVRRELPWLDPDSRQARDIERFRWFSDDFLALDRNDPSRVIDIRYSMIPNEIDPLWGIQLATHANLDQHATFFAERGGRLRQSPRLWQLFTGGC